MNRILTRIAEKLSLAFKNNDVWYPKDYNNILGSYGVPINFVCPNVEGTMNKTTRTMYAILSQLTDLFHEFVKNLRGGIGANRRTYFINKWYQIKRDYKNFFTASSSQIEKDLDSGAKNDFQYVTAIGEIFTDLSSNNGMYDVLSIDGKLFSKFAQKYGPGSYVDEFIKAREEYLKNASSYRKRGIESFADYIEYLVVDQAKNSFTNDDLERNRSVVNK